MFKDTYKIKLIASDLVFRVKKFHLFDTLNRGIHKKIQSSFATIENIKKY